MTDEDIAHERDECRKAVTDPTHPWHSGLMLIQDIQRAQAHEPSLAQTLTFLRKVAPYAFETTGEPLSVAAVAKGIEVL